MPTKLSNLEYKLLYAVIVAGKSATFAEGAMGRLRRELMVAAGANADRSWFNAIKTAIILKRLTDVVKNARVGNYTKVERAFREIVAANLNLRKCTVQELEALHGIGQKTSRFFLRWTGRRERFAVLDVHILRWLSELGYSVPKATPASKFMYRAIENLYLQEADKRGIHPADLDQQLWLERNKSGIRQ